MKRVMLALVMLMLVASPASACIGARQAAMGWAGVAISDDATCSYWNPAATVWAKDGAFYSSADNETAIAIKYDKYGFHFVDEGRKYFSLSYSHQLSEYQAIGLGLGWQFPAPVFYDDFNDDGFKLERISGTEGSEDYNGPEIDFSYFAKRGGLQYGVLCQGANVRPAIAVVGDYVTLSGCIYDLLDYFGVRHIRAGIEIAPFPSFSVAPSVRCGYNGYDEAVVCGVGLQVLFISFDFANINNQDIWNITCVF